MQYVTPGQSFKWATSEMEMNALLFVANLTRTSVVAAIEEMTWHRISLTAAEPMPLKFKPTFVKMIDSLNVDVSNIVEWAFDNTTFEAAILGLTFRNKDHFRRIYWFDDGRVQVCIGEHPTPNPLQNEHHHRGVDYARLSQREDHLQ